MPGLPGWMSWLGQERRRARIFGGGRLQLHLAADYCKARGNRLRPPRPRMIQLEPTRRCNLSCVMCQRTNRVNPDAEMGFDRFRRILDENFSYRHFLLLYGQGEPLLCADLFRMIRYERTQGNYVVSVTNGMLLTKEATGEIARSGLNMLRISIDGATEQTYRSVRKGASLPTVLENVRRLRSELDRFRAKTELAITFMALEENLEEIPALITLAKSVGVRIVEIKELAPYADEGREPLSVAAGRNPNLAGAIQRTLEGARARAKREKVVLITSRFGPQPRSRRCLNPWFKTFISAHGFVSPCSRLCFYPEAVLGRLPEDHFDRIWFGARYRQARSCIAAGGDPFEGCRKLPRSP
ncbi:MAG: radical SAM protein [Candidatus Eisenbacteria bacterium]